MENIPLPNDYSIVINNIENTVQLKFRQQKLVRRKNVKDFDIIVEDFRQMAVEVNERIKEVNERINQSEFAKKLLKELPI